MSIEINSLHFSRGSRFTLSADSLQFPAGKITAILGPSGAGKSTLLGILAGDLTDYRGNVTLFGQNIRDLDQLQAAILRSVMRSEDIAWLPLTVGEVIETGGYAHFREKRAVTNVMSDTVRRQLRHFDLEELVNAPFDTLSSGQKQRAQFIRAFRQAQSRERFMLILDEPFSHQDPGHAKGMIESLHSFRGEGRGCIMVLHDLNLAAQVCDHFILMNQGEIISQGDAAEVLKPDLLEKVYQIPFRSLQGGLMPLFTTQNSSKKRGVKKELTYV